MSTPEGLRAQLQYLHLRGLLANWDEVLKTAAAKNLSHGRLLEYVVAQEYRLKRDNARRLRQNGTGYQLSHPGY